jgi:hypothetical protein
MRSETKFCPRCQKQKLKALFSKNKSEYDGLQSWCKPCSETERQKQRDKRRGTTQGFKLTSWHNINGRTANGAHPRWSEPRKVSLYLAKGVKLLMSKQEYYLWCDQHTEEIEDLYKAGKTPSVDRIDSSGHYSADNLRIIEADENLKIGRDRAKALYSKPVVAFKDGVELKFPSMSAAGKSGFCSGHISRCVNGKIKTHGGYRWREGR